jgi:ABC-type uncharacterized transport system involved in gliding motility auxiliary subunit
MLKKSAFGTGSLLLAGLLIVGVLLLANTLLRGAQIDLTADKLYTISGGTRNIVDGLEEPVNLYLFFSERAATPIPQLKTHGTRVRELLERLAARSGGKLTLKVVDPEPFSEEEDRATELGVQGMQLSAGGEKLYLGLAATNSTDGKESIPFLDPQLDEQLEYDVARLIHKLSNAKRPVVGWLSSLPMGGNFDMQTGRPQPPWVVFGQVEQMYDVRTLEPSLTAVDADVDVLVLVHPKDLPPAALYAIDQYAMRGGRILAFIDPNSQADQSGNDPGNPMAQFQMDRSSHLEPLLSSWGVEFKPDQVVADLERGLVVAMREGEPPSQHIAILGLDRTSLGKDVITAQLDSLNVATAGSLKPLQREGDEAGKLTFEPLIHTSAQAGLLPASRFSMMSDPSTLRDGFKPGGELVIAARVSGEAKSAYADGPPAGVTPAADALKASAKPLNVVLIADSDLLSDFMWVQQRNFFGQTVAQPFANNGELVWNAVDNLAGSADLISIRGRASYQRPFERVDELRRTADAQFRNKELELEQQLQQTEDNLSKLQSAQPGSDALLSADQVREIERFQQDKLRIRKELRAVKAGLERDIKSLGMWMKFINIVLVPLFFVGVALMVALWHRRRRHAIAMLRKVNAP